jgi:hypothetical protein
MGRQGSHLHIPESEPVHGRRICLLSTAGGRTHNSTIWVHVNFHIINAGSGLNFEQVLGAWSKLALWKDLCPL